MNLLRICATLTCCGLGAALPAEFEFNARDRQPTPEELAQLPAVMPAKAAALLKEVKAPPEFEVTVFATPPAVNYPVFVAAAPDGTLYVSSDGNGSLDRKPHRGRVLRVRDTDGDGQADRVQAFVPDVDSPRGLVWDRDRLYLLHPPDISVFIDHDGDGVADEEKPLVRGIGWTFKERPADHASNGLELGMDGWLYAAVGDFGFMGATGTDGRKLQLRGGGVVRVRPDGTGLELWAQGTRNILEVAVSPLMDLFARDNTNDGGGWDVRFHHFSGLTQHGYPRLFKNFPGEFVPPLADYGGGSGCGAAWIDEPGIPAAWNNAPFTADWGRERVYHHGLKPSGATFTATQEEFIRLPRVTDLDVDARSAIYAASWKGASFTWAGPDVGYIVRLSPKGYQPESPPDFERASPEELIGWLRRPSHRVRLAASRELVRRHSSGPALSNSALKRLRRLAGSADDPLAARVAALFTLELALGQGSSAFLASSARDPRIASWALRALGDLGAAARRDAAKPVARALKSSDPTTRKEGIIAAAKVEPAEGASVTRGASLLTSALASLLADPDPIVAHTAGQALLRLHAYDGCLEVLDRPDASPSLRAGALRVLQCAPEPRTVDALIGRLSGETDEVRRQGLLTALCRLHFVEGPWKGDSWGTRPDTRGPFYQPEKWSETAKVGAALKQALEQATGREAVFIGSELARHRIPAGAALDLLLTRAAGEPGLLPAIAVQLAQADEVPAQAVPLLVLAATGEASTDATRAQAVMALVKTGQAEAWRAVLQVLPVVQRTKAENNLAERAGAAFRSSPRLDEVADVFAEEAARLRGESSVLADGALLRLAARKVGAPASRETARRALDSGWAEPRRRVQILRAAAQTGDASRAAQFVAALDDAEMDVRQAARETVRRLRIDPERFRAEASAKKIADLPLDLVLGAVLNTRGEATRGEQLFTQLGCNACHTMNADEPLKGPFLGTIANIYRRRELAEAILVPNKTIAQGFVANHMELKDGTEVDGFIVREAAEAVTIRTITAEERTIPVNQIVKREKQERSLMPEGLAAGLSVQELASLLDYLESLPKTK